MSEFVFAFHSGFRYVVLVLGVAAAAVAAIGMVSGPDSFAGRFALRLFRVFVVTVDVQVVLGLAVIAMRPFQPMFMGHIVMMVLALGVAHGVAVMMKKRAATKKDTAPILAGVAVVLALIAGGIMAMGRPIF